MTEAFLEQIFLLALVMMRMAGFVLLSPILGRRGIPALSKAGMILALTAAVFAGADTQAHVTVSTDTLGYAFLLFKEFVMGYLLGFTMQLFLYIMTHTGAIVDFQMGLSMATVYDPVNGSQSAVTGSLLNIYYIMLFFAADGHLAMMKILLLSAQVVPYGQVAFGPDAWHTVSQIFRECTVMAVKLSFPVIATELLLEVGVGILMKMVPQINLFIINIQLKIVVGLASMIFLISPVGDIIEVLINRMLNSMQDVMRLMAG